MEGKKKKKRLLLGWKWLWHTEKRKEKKFLNTKSCKLFPNFTILTSSFCLALRIAPISLFFIFYFISLFAPFSLFMILFTKFYPWIMVEILQILLLISYKLACHQSKKIILNIYSLYFLSNTNNIFTPLVCKFFSSYELVIFVYLF